MPAGSAARADVLKAFGAAGGGWGADFRDRRSGSGLPLVAEMRNLLQNHLRANVWTAADLSIAAPPPSSWTGTPKRITPEVLLSSVPPAEPDQSRWNVGMTRVAPVCLAHLHQSHLTRTLLKEISLLVRASVWWQQQGQLR